MKYIYSYFELTLIKNNGYKLTITELTSDRLIIEIAGSNEDGDWSVAKYKRMN